MLLAYQGLVEKKTIAIWFNTAYFNWAKLPSKGNLATVSMCIGSWETRLLLTDSSWDDICGYF